MCGILGVYNLNGNPIDEASFIKMGDQLIHRGPDGEGCFINSEIGLIHKRLSILDTSEKGKQPMYSKNKKWIVVFNGCIYNFKELRSELEKLGHVFESDSDTEVIVEGLSAHGTTFFERFNGMFAIGAWNVEEKKLIDFYGGLKDIENQKLRLIGNPKLRYKEDPIRLLRAIRFAAKLKIKIDGETLSELKKSTDLLESVPYSRLFDEIMKLFLTGHAEDSMVLFKKYKLSCTYFPTLENENKTFQDFLSQALINTDLRIKNDQSVNPGFFLAVFLWHDVQKLSKKYSKNFPHPSLALNKAIDDVLYKQAKIFPIQKRFSITMSEIWRLQPRFKGTSTKKIYRLLSHPRFRASYDFMLLRCQVSEISKSEFVTR